MQAPSSMSALVTGHTEQDIGNVVAMQIRDVILGCFMVGWIAVAIITAWKTGSVPAELWAVPGVGIGALMALFRNTDGKRDQDAPVANQEAQKELPS